MTMRIAFDGGKAVAEVTTLAGNSSVAIIHASNVARSARGNGVGAAAHLERLERLRDEFLYDVVVSTVDESNTAQVRIMTRNGWTRAVTWTASRSGNQISLWTKALV